MICIIRTHKNSLEDRKSGRVVHKLHNTQIVSILILISLIL